MKRTKVVIIGAGPAGLTAGYELLKANKEYEVIILEETDCIGGISKTVEYKGNRMDMGGHRFFSKSKRVNQWWQEMLPLQGAPAKDDILLNREVELKENGADPEQDEAVFLKRNRISRIYFNKKFFDYPISLKWETIKNMGFFTTMEAGMSYLFRLVFKKKETSLENFYINRFGKKLYSMFFESYTKNLWGRHPSEISAEWGAQRVKGLSVMAIIKDVFAKLFHKKNAHVETSLIEKFYYPKLGPGQMWELTASKIQDMGGVIIKNAKVIGIHKEPLSAEKNADFSSKQRICGISYRSEHTMQELDCDILISTMPLKDLVLGMDKVPELVKEVAKGLPYRDYITAGLLLNRLELKNNTKYPTVGNIVPDSWIYVHDKNMSLGRIQIYNNWSPYLVKDLEHTVFVGLEYFCKEGDSMWNLSDEEFADMAIKEFLKMGCISSEENVLDYHVEHVKKAYPAYFDTYDRIEDVRTYLNTIENLYCIGRNGQHRYNNMDHSMETAFEAVECIVHGKTDKSSIWNVNTEQEYHEEQKDA